MKRYKTEQLRVSGPIRGFLIHTPSGKTMRDIYPNTIVKELNRMAKRIKRLEKACGEMVSEEDTYIRLQTWLKAKEDKP